MTPPYRFARKNKFGARKTVCLGKKHPHPSALEAGVCDLLTAREQKNEITDVKWIATVHLTQSVRWEVDFRYTDTVTGKVVHVEAKGKETADYRIKRNLWRDGFGPGELQIWKGDYRRPQLVQTFFPKERT